ncbi:MAG: hypothetical protein ABJK25_06270 [Halieaceae bacterium]
MLGELQGGVNIYGRPIRNPGGGGFTALKKAVVQFLSINETNFVQQQQSNFN